MMTSLFKKVCRLAGNAIVEYRMIEEGDRILAGISGGKDSMVLLRVLKHFSGVAPIDFALEAVTFDPGFPGFSAEETGEFCRSLSIPHHIVRFDVPALLEEKKMSQSPCMLCSRLRRGNLYSLAKKLRCNKIALGQHLDDVAVSFLMSLCRGAGLSTMGPNVPAEKYDIRTIRPLIFIPESLLGRAAAEMELPVRGECLYKDRLEDGDRRYFKQILDEISERIPDLRSNFLRSLSNIQEGFLLDRKFLGLKGGRSEK